MLPSPAQAESLQAVVLQALEVDPGLAEAGANIAAAEARTESTRRQHWPRLSVAAAEPLERRQQADFFNDDRFRTYATLNVFSGGGIGAQVESDEDAEDYYRRKGDEGREDIAYRAAQLYLEGLRAEQELTLANTNLLRHNSLTRDLGVVAKLDSGRRSDLIQAQSRESQAKARLVAAETAVGVVQARLLRYTRGRQVTFEPVNFSNVTAGPPTMALVSRQPEYQAQVAEVERLKAQVDVVRARRWPKLDVETSVGSDTQSRLLLNWEVANGSSFANVDAAKQQLLAAQARLATIEFDLRERLDTARVNYEQSGRKLAVTEEQIGSAQQVVSAFEEQFQIARRSMLDLLNAYGELSGVESSSATAQSDNRLLALQYLRAAGQTEAWARLATSATQAKAEARQP